MYMYMYMYVHTSMLFYNIKNKHHIVCVYSQWVCVPTYWKRDKERERESDQCLYC